MVAYKDRARMAAQRIRVYEHEAEIRRMIAMRMPLSLIKERLGLDDMPYNSFRYHAAKIRDTPTAALPVADTIQTPSPASVVEPQRNDPAPQAKQPKGELDVEPREKRHRPRKRKFVDANLEYEKEHGKPKTKLYDPRDARKIK